MGENFFVNNDMQVIVFYWGEFLKTDAARCFYNTACYQLSKQYDCFFFVKYLFDRRFVSV